jgi:hypothetical protein
MTQDQWNAQAAGDVALDSAEAGSVEAEPVSVPADASPTQGDGDNAAE